MRLRFGLLLVFCLALAEDCLAQSSHMHQVSIVQQAFAESSDGWSVDEVILQDDLNDQFLKACRRHDARLSDADWNWVLLNARKAGAIRQHTRRRRADDTQPYRHLSEIVARLLQDRHQVSIDRVMCDPKLRLEFDREAATLTDVDDPYPMRKAALGLRKARQLRPELVLRVADWERQILTWTLDDLQQRDPQLLSVPEGPGVYLFRDRSGYLYIGEAVDVRDRLTEHLTASDRKSLAQYFESHGIAEITIEVHAFPVDSPARKVSVRRAYESELIASRQPRLNVRP